VAKARPDVNDILRGEGPEGVRDRYAKAKRYNGAAHAKPDAGLILRLTDWLKRDLPLILFWATGSPLRAGRLSLPRLA